MNPLHILFVFRKPNKGNFSIEKIYDLIYSKLKLKTQNLETVRRLTLNRNYDVLYFLKAFFSSFFTRKFIAHITGGCNYMVMAYPFKIRVLTIHDLYHYSKMPGIKGRIYDSLYYHLPVRLSHKIVVVSDNTKSELLESFRVPEEKIVVIDNPLVIHEGPKNFRQRTFSINEPINILQIGDKPLKNYERLLKATKEMNVHYTFVHSDVRNIAALIKKFNLDKRAEVVSNISDEELYELYSKCDVLFFASEAEGFGLPIIEAQYFGLQVITSDIPPMNVVGEGAVLVDPLSIDSIKNGFLTLYDSKTVSRNNELSKANVDRFSPDKIVHDYLKFYQSIS